MPKVTLQIPSISGISCDDTIYLERNSLVSFLGELMLQLKEENAAVDGYEILKCIRDSIKTTAIKEK